MSDIHPYIDENGTVTDHGIALYLEAMLKDDMESLPQDLFLKIRDDSQLRSEMAALFLEARSEEPTTKQDNPEQLVQKLLNDQNFMDFLREGMDKSGKDNPSLEKRLTEIEKSASSHFADHIDQQVFVEQIEASFQAPSDAPVYFNLIDHEENSVEEWTIPEGETKLSVNVRDIPTGKYYFTIFMNHEVKLGKLFLCSKKDALDFYAHYRKDQ